MMKNDKLDRVKRQNWFYEFTLPDGSRTNSYLPGFIRPIHSTREKVLKFFLEESRQNGSSFRTALDVSCHEGYYSLLLADRFDDVVGIDKNADSLDKARLITDVLGRRNVRYVHTSLEAWEEDMPRDFVLCFGLLYHIENPVEVIRKLATLTRKAICIESQVLPIDARMQIEDGYYTNQREAKGMFGLCMDYPDSKEGGLTELALVPSRDALVTLLQVFGFTHIRFYQPVEGDYEQFVRGHRVILHAEKT